MIEIMNNIGSTVIWVKGLKVSPNHRPRVTRFGRAYLSSGYKKFKDSFLELLSKEKIQKFTNKKGKSLGAYIEIYISPAKSNPKKAIADLMDARCKKGGDCDNLAKGIFDCLNGIAYEDDRQFTDINLAKIYADFDGFRISIYEQNTGSLYD
jgi:Holliday junction resolvase RusA-like endonuclease